MSPVLEDRLPVLETLTLKYGGHKSLNDGCCVMEAVAYVAGEPWSDTPECACPVISTFLRSWNDSLPTDADRNRLLLPLVPKIVGTRSTPEVELARVMLCIDWSIREWLPTWLDLTPLLAEHAARLRACKPIQSWPDFDAAVSAIAGARDGADAARDAARAAAWDAAWDAARAAAWDAARAAAWAAAWAAARDALKPTTLKLQDSAVALVERMIAVK